MIKYILSTFSIFTLATTLCQSAQSPDQLTTDLIEHTDRIFLDGYPANITLNKLGTAIERYQVAEIRTENPCMGWVVNSNKPNTLQVAYRILVATSEKLLEEGKADMWDSQRVESDNSVAIMYQGNPLKTSNVYYWKVKTWDNHGYESNYSNIKGFMTAKRFDNKPSQYPLQITDEYPIKITDVTTNIKFIDFGKTAFGKLKISLSSVSDRDTLTVHFGEHAVNGRVDRKPGGSIRYRQYKLPLLKGTHTYTIKIEPDERNTAIGKNESWVTPILMPDYIGEVYPFRYCEIENYNSILTDKNVVRQSVTYPFNDNASFFDSSDSIMNQVWDLCKHSIKATSFLGTYVDGDRERIPYEADAIINQLCHYYVDREFSMARHSHEHLIYNPTWPTEWNLQTILIAWNDYLYTGNKKSLKRCYSDLKAKTLLALKEDNGLISTQTGKITDEFKRSIHFKGKSIRDIVDWPQSGIVGDEKSEAGEADGFVFTKYNAVVNAYHYQAVNLMSKIAELLNYEEDAQKYKAEAEKVKTQFNKLLFDTKKGYYKDGIDTDHGSLHANMFPMAFDMISPKNRNKVAEFIRSRRMACSVYGAQFLMEAIYNAENCDYGLSLISSTAERSWYNMLRAGSTISMEAWDNKYKPNQDWNHAWGAVPANIIPRKIMGVEPLEPGFKAIRIKPQPATLRQASAQIPTIRGEVRVSFDNIPGKRFTLNVEIPANTTAEVWLPYLKKTYKLQVDQVSQRGIVAGNFVKVFIGSGKHSFVIE